jgi:hypothetical protein
LGAALFAFFKGCGFLCSWNGEKSKPHPFEDCEESATRKTSQQVMQWLSRTHQMMQVLDALRRKMAAGSQKRFPLREVLDACLKSPEVAVLNFSGIRMGQLVQGADEFYKDFRNKSIAIQLAMRYVRDQLNGKPDKDLADELAGWRRTANK